MNQLKIKSLNTSKNYVKFVDARDRANETILNKYLTAMGRVVTALKNRTSQIVSHELTRNNWVIPSRAVEGIGHKLSPEFERANHQILVLAQWLRVSTYTLTKTSEAEAIGRGLGKVQKISVHKHDLQAVLSKDAPSGGALHARIGLYLSRIKHDALNAVQMGLTLEEKPAEVLARVEKEFPKKQLLKKPPRVLRPLKERDAPFTMNLLSTGFVEPDAWDDAMSDYQEAEMPWAYRDPEDKSIFFGVDDAGQAEFTERYDWEVEQEITQDFVQSVRDGQVDAANENGIDDFQWIAVIDSHTDDCCAWRDGLTSSEIEQQLEDGAGEDDDEGATVPPAHFRCRCRPAPMSSDMPDVAPPDFGSFDDWLNQKAA